MGRSATPLSPVDAAEAVIRLVEPPSAIAILPDGLDVALLHMRLAEAHHLTARRVHDARHAATALHNGVIHVYTYDPDDWSDFVSDGIVITAPPSTRARMAPPTP